MSAHLSKVINEFNWMAKFSKNGREIDPRNLTISDATALFRFIDCELSPEHLTMDGERSSVQVMNRQSMLDGATTALQRKGFRMPADTWNM